VEAAPAPAAARRDDQPRVRGFETDVIEAGAPFAHALTHREQLVGAGLDRQGTISAIARDDEQGALALISGTSCCP
jgi:hypothetical protein